MLCSIHEEPVGDLDFQVHTLIFKAECFLCFFNRPSLAFLLFLERLEWLGMWYRWDGTNVVS